MFAKWIDKENQVSKVNFIENFWEIYEIPVNS